MTVSSCAKPKFEGHGIICILIPRLFDERCRPAAGSDDRSLPVIPSGNLIYYLSTPTVVIPFLRRRYLVK
jgi:hypothetical protein